MYGVAVGRPAARGAVARQGGGFAPPPLHQSVSVVRGVDVEASRRLPQPLSTYARITNTFDFQIFSIQYPLNLPGLENFNSIFHGNILTGCKH